MKKPFRWIKLDERGKTEKCGGEELGDDKRNCSQKMVHPRVVQYQYNNTHWSWINNFKYNKYKHQMRLDKSGDNDKRRNPFIFTQPLDGTLKQINRQI